MDIVAYALGKKFTSDTASQFGAIKGANCQVSSYSEDSDGNTIVTFSWKNDAGTVKTTPIKIKKGADGLSIKTAIINSDNHLIITYSDDTILDAGLIDTKSTLSDDLTATVEIGTVSNGKKYLKGTSLEQILRDMLIKEESPVVTLSLLPNKTVYDIVSESISNITLKATVTKKTYNIAKIEFYADSTLIQTIDSNVSNGGVFNYSYNPATPINKTTIFKVVVTDIKGKKSTETSSNKITVSFVGNSYYGFVESTIGEPIESQIKTLNKNLKISKGYEYKNITCTYNKVVYSYPQSFGALTSIKDKVNNFNYTDSFSRISLKIDGIDYYCYTQKDASALNDVNLTFE